MIINATNIGEKLSGLGRFSLYFAKYFYKTYEVIINKKAEVHFNKEELQNMKIVSERLSPDFGFKGHLKRLIFSNKIKDKVLNLSQMEMSIFNDNQLIVVHDIIPLLFPKLHKKQYFFFKYILPLGLKKAKKVIAISNHTALLLNKYYNLPFSKIKVIHNGIFLPNKNEIISKENYILYVGRDSETKNISRLIQSFELLSTEFKNLKLYLVGVEREFENKNIISLGYVDDNKLDLLYRKSLMFIFPSLYEGFGYPPLEAMARRTAVIVSNVASLPEICKDSALYVNPYDVKDIYLNIKRLLLDVNLRKELEHRGYERAKLFNIENTLKNYENLLREYS